LNVYVVFSGRQSISLSIRSDAETETRATNDCPPNWVTIATTNKKMRSTSPHQYGVFLVLVLVSSFLLCARTVVVALEASSFPRNTALDHHTTFADHEITTQNKATDEEGSAPLPSHQAGSASSSSHHSTLERGVPLPEEESSSLDPEALYEIFRRLRRHYLELAAATATDQEGNGSGADDSWQIMYQYQNITISMLQHPHDPTCPYVKMEAHIPVSTMACWNFLRVEQWDISMPKMDHFYEGTEVYGTYVVPSNNASIKLCRKRMTRLFAFGKRDMVFLSVEDALPAARTDNNKSNENGTTLVSGSVSVTTDRIPRQKGYTRAYQDSISFYKAVPRHGNDIHQTATYVTSTATNCWSLCYHPPFSPLATHTTTGT
jgi:hypothetical protein